MSWIEGQLLGFDLETDSPSPFTALPCSYAFVLRRSADRMSVATSLVNPGKEIPAEATAIHGITTEKARAEGKPLAEGLEAIQEKLIWGSNNDIPLTGCNVSYDLSIIERLIGLDAWAACVVDVYILDRHYDQYRKGKRTLSHLCQEYGVSHDVGEAHDASGDAVSAILVALAMAERYPELGEMNMVDLHNCQEVWADEQKASLSAYFVKQGNDPIPEEEFGWPIQNGAKFKFHEGESDGQPTY